MCFLWKMGMMGFYWYQSHLDCNQQKLGNGLTLYLALSYRADIRILKIYWNVVSVLIIKIKSRSAILLHAGPAPQYTCVHEHDQVTGIGSNSDDVSDVVFFFFTLYWFAWEEVFTLDRLDHQTLSFVVYCWIPDGWHFLVELWNLRFWW